MKATQPLPNLGQSIWLDNITTQGLLDGGALKHYIEDLSATGLTSDPTIFDHAFKSSNSYDSAIREKLSQGKSAGDCERVLAQIGKAGIDIDALPRRLQDEGRLHLFNPGTI